MTDQNMTDQNMTDQIQEVIDMLAAHAKMEESGDYGIGYTNAIENCLSMLEALLPKPPTLADELSEFAESLLGGGSVSDVKRQLILFADRVEALEQERDELAYAREEGRAAASNWENTARRLKEAEAEIDRLRDRDNDDSPTPEPGHPTHLKTEEDYQNAPIGTIVQMEVPGWAHFIKDDEGCWATKGFIGYYTSESMSGTPCVVVEWGTAPEATPEPGHIDPTTCGRFRPYLVEVNGKGERVMIRHDDDNEPWVDVSDLSFWKDDELTVLRRLTPEEMDER